MYRLSDKLTVELAALCEDIREEKGGKITLIGVFSGDVQVTELPAKIRVAFYFSLQSTKLEDLQLKIRFSHDDTTIVEADAPLHLTDDHGVKRHFANLIIPLGIMSVEKPTWLRVSIQAEGHDWVEVIKKFIFDGAATPPSASVQPASQSPDVGREIA